MRLVIVFLVILVISCKQQSTDPGNLTTSKTWQWLPQHLKDTMVFAKGVISVFERNEMAITFSPSGDTCYFSVLTGKKQGRNCWSIMYSVFDGKNWSKGDTCSFSGHFSDYGPFYSPVENAIYFSSRRPVIDTGTIMLPDYDLWKVTMTDSAWNEPKRLAEGINTKMEEYSVSCSNKYLYICASRNDRLGGTDVFRVERKEEFNPFAKVINLGAPVNDENWQGNPYVTNDDALMAFNYVSDDTTDSENIVYIVNDKGKWKKPVYCSDMINTKRNEFMYCLSPCRRFIFFGRNGDIYIAPFNLKIEKSSD